MNPGSAHWAANAPAVLAEFRDLLAIPNVATDPDALAGVAEWIRAAFARRGVDAAVHSVDGAPPVVIGRVLGDPSGPTVGIYAHYDGQPVVSERWSSPPFTPTLLTATLEDGGESIDFPGMGEDVDPEWRIYARGSADDRAPIIGLLGALDAVAKRSATIVFLFEGEEEQGSPSLGDYLADLAADLAADVWLICDGPVHQSGRPQVALGVRGFAEIELEVFGPPHDLHSGHYGETAINPAVALSQVLASMRDAEGALSVAGLGGPDPSDAATAAAALVPDPDGLGFSMNANGGYAARLLRPLLNVRGLRAGDVGSSSRNVVPASAVASIDLRLVAGQDPAAMIEAVRDHVSGLGYHLVDTRPTAAERMSHRLLARVEGVAGYPGVRTDPDHPIVQRVIETVAAAAGEDPILLPSFGGSVPLHHFGEHLDAPLAIIPIANHDNNQHSEDENLRVGNLEYAVRVMSAILSMGG